ncbi:hypothetical protein K3495_g4224 [Podosphaera aphanis]|nr:hypothetical protein K3495_g4224 [Podosphaera aphanis]
MDRPTNCLLINIDLGSRHLKLLLSKYQTVKRRCGNMGPKVADLFKTLYGHMQFLYFQRTEWRVISRGIIYFSDALDSSGFIASLTPSDGWIS